jgi:hypothetical protein
VTSSAELVHATRVVPIYHGSDVELDLHMPWRHCALAAECYSGCPSLRQAKREATTRIGEKAGVQWRALSSEQLATVSVAS